MLVWVMGAGGHRYRQRQWQQVWALVVCVLCVEGKKRDLTDAVNGDLCARGDRHSPFL